EVVAGGNLAAGRARLAARAVVPVERALEEAHTFDGVEVRAHRVRDRQRAFVRVARRRPQVHGRSRGVDGPVERRDRGIAVNVGAADGQREREAVAAAVGQIGEVDWLTGTAREAPGRRENRRGAGNLADADPQSDLAGISPWLGVERQGAGAAGPRRVQALAAGVDVRTAGRVGVDETRSRRRGIDAEVERIHRRYAAGG